MSITLSKARWSAGPRFKNASTNEKTTEEQRNQLVLEIAKFVPGGVGKGKKYRYASDFAFPSEAAAHKFWDKHFKRGNLDPNLVEISCSYRLYW